MPEDYHKLDIIVNITVRTYFKKDFHIGPLKSANMNNIETTE